MNNETILNRLNITAEKINVVLDTDTYNEVDDQFALVYAICSKEKINLQAVYAAPFYNDRSASPEDGMIKSYDEILRLLEKMNIPNDGFVFKGSKKFLSSKAEPVVCDAVNDLIERALATPENKPLYVVAIGAITNVASAIILKPEIIEKMIVVWLGGNPHYWNDTAEFNMLGDVKAAQVVFDSKVPLVQIPCMGVASHLLTTLPELEKYIKGKNNICDTLVELYKNYNSNHYGWAKEIWDIAAVAYVINPDWIPSDIVHTPVLNENCTYSFDNRRHLMKVAKFVNRNAIFKDMYNKIIII